MAWLATGIKFLGNGLWGAAFGGGSSGTPVLNGDNANVLNQDGAQVYVAE